jgi:hypothetical protein
LNTNVSAEVQARNRQEVEKTIGQCLEQVIRGFLPWQAITKKYFNTPEPTEFVKAVVSEAPPVEESKGVSFDDSESESEDDEEEAVPKLHISEEDASLDLPEEKVEEVDPMAELEQKASETLVLNL